MIVVVRAKKDIRPGTIISLDVLEVVNLPDSAFDPDAIKSTSQAIGKTARNLILQSSQLRIHDLEGGAQGSSFVTSSWEQLKSKAEKAVEQRVYQDAEKYWGLALKEAERELSKPMSIICLDGLGDLYCLEKRFPDAETAYTDSLIIKIELVGEEHPVVASGLSKLSNAMYHQGKIEAVESLLARALPIFMGNFGSDHSETRATISKLERVYSDQGKQFEKPTDPVKWLTEAEKIVASSETDARVDPLCPICHRPFKGKQCLRCTQFGTLVMLPVD